MSGATAKGVPPSSTPGASIAATQLDQRKAAMPTSIPATKANITSLYSSTLKPICAPPSGSSSAAVSVNGTSVAPRPTSTINKNDLINSNPEAVASSSSNTNQKARLSTASDNEKDDSRGEDVKKSRRRKANRACSHCQKAHLTCDDSRPCERCVKKGLSDTCTDGARKKAKYLLDEDEILELKRQKERKQSETRADYSSKGIKDESDEASNRLATPSDWPTPSSTAAQLSPAQLVSIHNSAANLGPSSLHDSTQSQPLSAVKPSMLSNGDTSEVYGPIASFSPTSSSGLQHAFGSETTSLEYSILSSMLNGIDPAWLSGSSDGSQAADHDLGRVLKSESTTSGPFSHMGLDGMPWQLNNDDTSAWRNAPRGDDRQDRVEPLHHMDSTISANNTSTDGLAAFDALEVPSPQGAAAGMEVGPRNGHMSLKGEDVETASAKLAQSAQYGRRAAAAVAAATGQDKKPDALWNERVKHIYSDKMKPFPYTEGYHFLIKYVTANLEKAQVLRIVRALAIFRPSLIALQMPLTEEDEIFVERSIQRTIMEFEKLISFSGTPTVVWRRTCEVVVVGSEFSMLTQWSKDHLRGRYIYEFFDKPSILEYWEKFALHAFENTAQSIMMQVALKTSTGNTVKCAACFSIKRDVFDLPSLIVGNFLPILS